MLGNVSLQTSDDETNGVDTANGLNIVGVGTDSNASDGIINVVSVADVFADTVQVDPDNDATTNNSFTAGLLANHGGATQTIALAGNALNPALNAGLNNVALGITLDETATGIDFNGDGDTTDIIDSIDDFTFDQRGVGFDRVVGGQIDIGAFEADPPPVLELSLIHI